MINLSDKECVHNIKTSCHVVFDTAQGKEVLELIEQICNWTPSVFDSNETNDIIARDARRQVLGTIKTILKCSPEQIVALTSGA